MKDLDPGSCSVIDLFNNKKEQFIIPAYQRRFSWEKEHFLALFNDIYFLEPNEKHLMNMITLINPSHTGKINTIEVVDGQQRMTAFIILVKLLRDSIIKLRNSNENLEAGIKVEVSDAITHMTSCLHAQEKRKSPLIEKLILGQMDKGDFESLMSDDLSSIENQNLTLAYNLFQEKINELNIDEKLDLFEKLDGYVQLIRVDISKPKDAYRLFEITNNRGKDLTVTDKIKNFLLGHAALLSERNPIILTKVKDLWQQTIKNLDGIDDDVFFRQFLMGVLFKPISSNELIKEFKYNYYFKNIENVDILQDFKMYCDNHSIKQSAEELNEKISIVSFCKNLSDASHIYRKIVNNDFDNNVIRNEMANLQKIEGIPSYTFLLNIIRRNQIEDKVLIKVIKIIQVFMLRRHVCRIQTGDLNTIFSNLCEKKSDNIINKIKAHLNTERRYPTDGEFSDEFESLDLKGKVNRAKYILEMIEHYILPKMEFKINFPVVELEHIIPQSIKHETNKKKHGDWVKYLKGQAKISDEQVIIEHKRILHNIGNLTLLWGPLNNSANNSPWIRKKEAYQGLLNESKTGTYFEITKELLGYTYFRIKQTEERGKRFSKMAPQIWNFDNI